MSRAKVLIIDDDEAIRKSLYDTLTSQGFNVLHESNGKAGLDKALAEKPDLIVLDIDMPVLDGMGMLKGLRASGEWGKLVPVIILTNFDTTDQTIQGIVEHEPSLYLLKSKTGLAEIVGHIKEKLGSSANTSEV